MKKKTTVRKRKVHYKEIENECGKTIHTISTLWYYPEHETISIQSGMGWYGTNKSVACTFFSKIVVNGV